MPRPQDGTQSRRSGAYHFSPDPTVRLGLSGDRLGATGQRGCQQDSGDVGGMSRSADAREDPPPLWEWFRGSHRPRSTAQVHRLALLHCQLHFSGRHIVDSDLYPVAPPFTHPTVAVRPAIEELNGYRAGPGD